MSEIERAVAATTSRVDEGGLTRFHWKIEFVGGMHLLLASLDVGLLSFIYTQLVPEWHLTPWQMGSIGIANAVGTGLGAVIAGTAADRLGRKSVMRLCLAATAIGTLVGAISWDYVSLAIFQFVAGMGTAGVAPAVSVLVSEFAPARFRGRLMAITEFFWVSGWFVSVLGAYLIIPIWGWRAAFVFGGIPLIFVAIQSRLVPESPRFLLARGRKEEALRFLEMLRARYGIVQDSPSAPPSTQHRGVLAGLRELWSGHLARRTASTWILWFVLVFSYFGMFIWIPTLLATAGFSVMRTFEFAFVFTLAQFPATLLSVFVIDWVGRKWVIAPTLFICGVAAFFFGRAESFPELLVWGCLVSGSNIIGWSIMPGYTAELFPTRLRGTGTGWASAFGRLGAIIVPGAIALLLGSWASGYQIVFIMFSAVLILGALLIAILGEETKGRTLEEISFHR